MNEQTSRQTTVARRMLPTRSQCIGFVLLVSCFVVLPFAVPFVPWYHPGNKYLAMPASAGAYHFIYREIFEAEGDVDLLVVGDSIAQCAFDTSWLAEAWTERLGRPARVLNFATLGRSEERLVKLVEDLTSRRRVRALVYGVGHRRFTQLEVSDQVFRWWLPTENWSDLALVDARDGLRLIAQSVLGAPRAALSLLRSEIRRPEPDYDATGHRRLDRSDSGRRFEPNPADDDVGREAPQVAVTGPGPSQYQLRYLQKLATLLEKRDIAWIVTPIPLKDDRLLDIPAVDLGRPDNLPVKLVGISAQSVFGRFTEADSADFYFQDHLNIRGSRLYTRAIEPAIWRAVASTQK